MNPHVTDYTQQISKHTVTVEPLGDKRKEIEAAAKRAFNARYVDRDSVRLDIRTVADEIGEVIHE